MRKKVPQRNTLLWITEEWLIILIAILILLAIAIGAAGARTLYSPNNKTTVTQPLATNFGEDSIE